jgi:hypothetical protein
MGSAAGRMLIALTAGLAVVAVSFFATSEIMHHLLPSENVETSLIHIIAATYGKSCQNFVPPGRDANIVRPGNVTTIASLTCDGSDVICPVRVDVVRIDDPAPGCSKDFSIKWLCGADQTVHEIYLPAEAANETAWIGCPAQ